MQDDAKVQYAVWAPLTAFTATLFTVWWLVRSRLSRYALDHPNARSLHGAPVPRTGGIGIHAGIFLAWAVMAPELPPLFLPAAGLVLAISLLDDFRGVRVAARLAVHLIAASLLAASLLLDDFGLVAVVVAALALAW
ncbi:MAG: UDP-phosphate N-acetylglucosaminyl 1-phosphate transferase, partial [Betaproteobacteria bacterium]|nr:UDP-phosphate N-acetylglucosaminyl 1-phosphate transferase [Betaproteobacteria bacterium]